MMPGTKFLVALTGPIGSGKTHIARMLAKKLGAVHVRTDDIRVRLRKQGKSFANAPKIAQKLLASALSRGKTAVADFDALLPKRRQRLKIIAENTGARFILTKINTPEKLILWRLRKKKYTAKDLFKNAGEAIKVYFIRKKLHEKLRRRKLKIRPDFVINNARPLRQQIEKMIKRLRG